MTAELTATSLYARSQGVSCTGKWACHWCGSPCADTWRHNHPPRLTGERDASGARHPGSAYICVGCWMWDRKRITIPYLGGGYKDSQAPANHSWWVTEQGAWALAWDHDNKQALYKNLLNPPLIFSLVLLEGKGIQARLHLARANQNKEITATTPLHFTLNNIVHTYTVYELEDALRHGADGHEPGVRALLTLLGSHPLPRTEEDERKGKAGRPKMPENPSRKVIREG